ncbi:MAG: ParB N-terminal domain-containing protein, partial [Gammaproteobacteria bacterium]|nr:ParB N-terminal domain-containing protein [Gammaproteobacteria bacterium]
MAVNWEEFQPVETKAEEIDTGQVNWEEFAPVDTAAPQTAVAEVTPAVTPAKQGLISSRAKPIDETGFKPIEPDESVIAPTYKEATGGTFFGRLKNNLDIAAKNTKRTYHGMKMAEFAEFVEGYTDKKYTPEYFESNPKDKERLNAALNNFVDSSANYIQIGINQQRENPQRPAVEKILRPQGERDLTEKAAEIGSGLAEDPLGVIGDLSLQSAPMMLEAAAVVAGIRGAGGTKKLAAMGGGGVSAINEFGSDYAELRKEGKSHAEAWGMAATRAGVIGLFDMVSFNSAGKSLEKVLDSALLGKVATVGKETGRQMVLGAGGEGAGTLASGRDPELGEMAAEAIGETGGLFIEGPAMLIGGKAKKPSVTPPLDDFSPTHKVTGGVEAQQVIRNAQIVPDTYQNAQGEIIRDASAVEIPQVAPAPVYDIESFDLDQNVEAIKNEVEQAQPTDFPSIEGVAVPEVDINDILQKEDLNLEETLPQIAPAPEGDVDIADYTGEPSKVKPVVEAPLPEISDVQEQVKAAPEPEAIAPTEEKRPADFDQFIKLAEASTDAADFVAKAQEVKSIPDSTSAWYREKYDPSGELTVNEVADKFLADVKGGAYTDVSRVPKTEKQVKLVKDDTLKSVTSETKEVVDGDLSSVSEEVSAREWERLLPNMSRGVYEALSSEAFGIDPSAAKESELQSLREGLQKQGSLDPEALRELRERTFPDAPRGLRQAVGSELAVPEVSPRPAPSERGRGEGDVQDAGRQVAQRERREEGLTRAERRDEKARNLYDKMSKEELIKQLENRDKELRTHELTGIKGLRAFVVDVQDAETVGSIDADSLKWINDELSPEHGNVLLQAVADALEAETDRAYHISGDEFYVLGNTNEEVETIIGKAISTLANAKIVATKPDGRTITLNGLNITHGIGETKDEADTKQKSEKIAREEKGVRAARGEQPFSAVIEPAKRKQAERPAAEVEEYPLADISEWYGDADYKQRGGEIVNMSPDVYLEKVRPLDIDEVSRDNIDDLKEHIKSGRTLDPLVIYPDGKEDGRHRAHAAKELGIKEVPVIVFKAEKKPKSKIGKSLAKAKKKPAVEITDVGE